MPKRRPVAKRAAAAAPGGPGPVRVTRRVHFNAAHRLYNPAFGKDWNRRQYGPCANPNSHGHNYVVEVTVSGRPDPDSGFTFDLGKLKRILQRSVVDPCDHRNLNEDVPFLKGVIPTAENLAVAFWAEIAPRIHTGRLHCVRLYETPRNFVEYFGPETDPE